MFCRSAWVVQSTEDGMFLCADGQGGISFCKLFGCADVFNDPESAVEALTDHVDGFGVIIQVFIPD